MVQAILACLFLASYSFAAPNPYSSGAYPRNVRIISTGTLVGGNPATTSAYIYDVNAINVIPTSNLSSNTVAGINSSTQIVSFPQMANLGVIVGNGVGVFPSTATLTAGTNITLTYPNGAGGLTITSTGGGGGGGGSSTLAISTGTSSQAGNPAGTYISSPTAAINFNSGQFFGSLAANATAFISLDPVSLSTGVTGSLPAASIAGGTLGATVIASSVAVTAVTSGSYGSATQSPTYTVGVDGRLTAASNVTITGTTPGGSAGGDLTGTYPNPTLKSVQGNISNISSSFTVTGTSMTVNGSGGVTITYGVSVGSMTGAGLSTCGDATHGLGWASSNNLFTCQSITGSGGGGGGGGALAVTTGTSTGFTTVISSPTSVISFETTQFKVTGVSVSTAYIQISTPIITSYGGSGLASPSAHTVLLGEGSSAFTPLTLTNGQIPIGSTGNDPSAATISCTSADLTCTTGAGTFSIDTSQAIGTGASPTFVKETLTGISSNTIVGVNNTTTTVSVPALSNGGIIIGINGAFPSTGTISQGTGLTITNGAGTITAALTTPVAVGSGGTGTNSTLTGVVRGGNPFTAAEISGDATTSGSNVLSLAAVQGHVTTFTSAITDTSSHTFNGGNGGAAFINGSTITTGGTIYLSSSVTSGAPTVTISTTPGGNTLTVATVVGALSGNATTATALASAGTAAGSGFLCRGVDASGNCLLAHIDNTSGGVASSTQPITSGAINASGFLTANQTITVSGDVTGSGTTAITAALAASQGKLSTITSSFTVTGTSVTITGSGGELVTYGITSGTHTFTALSSNTIVGVNNATTTTSIPALGNGGLIIGGNGAFPSTGTLTAGLNITITNSPGGITIANTASAALTVGFASATITSAQTGIGTTFTTVTGSTIAINIQSANDPATVCFALDYDENAVGGGFGVVDVLVDNVRQGAGTNGGVLTVTDGVASQNNGNGVCIPTGALSAGIHNIYLQVKDASSSTIDLQCGKTTCFVSAVETGGKGAGTPGGSSGQLQYNNAGVFGGDANSYITSSSETFSGSGGAKVTYNATVGSMTFAGAGPFAVYTSSTGSTSVTQVVSIATNTSVQFLAAYASTMTQLAAATPSTFTWTVSNVQTSTLTANSRLYFVGGMPGERIALLLYQDATGSRTVTWTSKIQWAGGSAPTLTTTGKQLDIITCIYSASNDSYYCVPSLNFSP